MSDKRYETATVGGLELADGWSPIRRTFDIRAFGVNAWTGHRAGDVVIPEHDELPSRHEELYLVTSGKATFTVDEDVVEAPAGTLVFVREPSVRRGAAAAEPETTILALGGEPGVAFAPRAWELNSEVLALFDRGDYAGAKTLLAQHLEHYADGSSVLYNLACAEARLGEIEPALDHLRRAFCERPSLRADARRDEDLTPLHANQEFAAIVAEE